MDNIAHRPKNMLAAFFLTLLLPLSAFAGEWNTNKAGIVLDGYDVVAYRTQAQAVKGSSQFTAEHNGVKFHFSNKAHKELFVEDPELYLPKYNGYCALAIAGKKARVPANADTFKLYNGELLVFFNDVKNGGKKFNTKVPWNQDEEALFEQAEDNWKEMK
jgi:YHS domain-containing protein